MYSKKNNTKKHKISPKKTNPSWGLTHPPTFEFFGIFYFFPLDKTPYLHLFTSTKPQKKTFEINKKWLSMLSLHCLEDMVT